MKQTVIGLAGHIDHGKTALVKALTGTNTDKLQEEVRRGMTIDIGFAFLNEEVTLIDVPGHEKFVKNMMAGVSGIDAAMLVIAADDGVMPQTKEHFDILRLLDVKVGCIALNKIDLADEEWIDLVEMDIQELTKNTFLENAPIIRVSAINNTGIEKLKSTILDMVKSVPEKQDRGIFRMPMDRVFSIKGFGTVITGTVSSGQLKTGDMVEILPNGLTAKVRGLQSHTHEVNQVNLGDRGAVNLANIEKNIIERGFQIATPGYFHSTNQIGVEIFLLRTAEKPIVQNQRIRVHLATQEVMARVAIINQKLVMPGEKVSAILRLESPLVASYNDRIILRTYSPIMTIGGGTILDSNIKTKWKIASKLVFSLFEATTHERLEIIIKNAKSKPLTQKDIRYRLGLSDTQIDMEVSKRQELFWLKEKNDRWLLSIKQVSDIKKMIVDYIDAFQKNNRHKSGVSKEEIRQYLQADDRFIAIILQQMLSSGLIKQVSDKWSLPDHQIQLNDIEKEAISNLVKILNVEWFSSSNTSELSTRIHKTEKETKLLLKISQDLGEIIQVDGNLLFTKTNYDLLINSLKTYFKSKDSINVAEFKELANTSRKYAVPLLEYLDKMKITYRVGNVRKLV